MSSNNKQFRPVFEPENGIRSGYGPRMRFSIEFPENSPFTKQEFKDECDINILMRQYENHGIMPPVLNIAPQYLDVTGMDYREHMEVIAGAQSMFNELPSAVRNRFDNDPALFLDFCSDESNKPELLKMGLLRPDYVDFDTPLPSGDQNVATVKSQLLAGTSAPASGSSPDVT